jgi:hypothetical protein
MDKLTERQWIQTLFSHVRCRENFRRRTIVNAVISWGYFSRNLASTPEFATDTNPAAAWTQNLDNL